MPCRAVQSKKEFRVRYGDDWYSEYGAHAGPYRLRRVWIGTVAEQYDGLRAG